jgi:hypothetical protein
MVAPVPTSICSDFSSKTSLNVAKNCTWILMTLLSPVLRHHLRHYYGFPSHLSIQKKGNTGKLQTSSPSWYALSGLPDSRRGIDLKYGSVIELGSFNETEIRLPQ